MVWHSNASVRPIAVPRALTSSGGTRPGGSNPGRSPTEVGARVVCRPCSELIRIAVATGAVSRCRDSEAYCADYAASLISRRMTHSIGIRLPLGTAAHIDVVGRGRPAHHTGEAWSFGAMDAILPKNDMTPVMRIARSASSRAVTFASLRHWHLKETLRHLPATR
jgi:hypothetical protein